MRTSQAAALLSAAAALVAVAAAAAAVAPTAAYAGQHPAGAPDEPDPGTTFAISGAGASFPFPLIDLWRVEYGRIYDNVNLNYQSIGSGGGIKQHIERTVVFAASDKPLKGPESEQAPGTLHIPETIGGVVVAYNLPDLRENGLRLTGGVIADIFLGRIESWSDERIRSLNPGVDLPDRAIATVQRSDGSGTTFVFTDYLTTVSPDFDEAVGKGKSVPWPVGRGAAGNEGVAGVVKTTDYSIGYVELAYAFTSGINYAYVENGDGTRFVEPTLESLAAASAGAAAAGLPPAEGDWSAVTMVNAPGPDSYPMATFTYLLLYEEMDKVADSREEAKAVVHLINWMLTDGQSFSPGLLYVPLSDEAVAVGQAGLQRATYGGELLWKGDGGGDAAGGASGGSSGDAPAGEPAAGDGGGSGGQEPGAAGEPGDSDSGDGGGGCLVATAAYGSELAPQVQALREVRDAALDGAPQGALFMSAFNTAYYAVSPAVADLERGHPLFRDAARAAIAPAVAVLSAAIALAATAAAGAGAAAA